MMTKAEERAALSKIENILKDAGPDSYIGMAFTGCCELARDNIENDFGQSFPDRLGRLEHDNGVYSKAVDTMTAEIRKLKEEREKLRAEIAEARALALPAELYKSLWLLVDEKARAAITRMDELAETLAGFADCPADIAVTHALRNLGKAKKDRDEAMHLLQELGRYEPANV